MLAVAWSASVVCSLPQVCSLCCRTSKNMLPFPQSIRPFFLFWAKNCVYLLSSIPDYCEGIRVLCCRTLKSDHTFSRCQCIFPKIVPVMTVLMCIQEAQTLKAESSSIPLSLDFFWLLSTNFEVFDINIFLSRSPILHCAQDARRKKKSSSAFFPSDRAPTAN